MSKILNVPFYAQNDNEPWFDGAHGSVQCELTSTAMLLAYLKPGVVDLSRKNGFVEVESYLKSKYRKYTQSRGNHDATTQCLKNEFGVDSVWRYDLSTKDLVAQIDKGLPVTIGVEYKTAGHIIIVIGYDNKGFFVHDPYGSRNGAQDSYLVDPGHLDYGKEDHYSFSLIRKIWSMDREGWGRIVLSK